MLEISVGPDGMKQISRAAFQHLVQFRAISLVQGNIVRYHSLPVTGMKR